MKVKEDSANKCLDAGTGNRGAFFSLVSLAGKLFVHVNVSKGYMVFRAVPESNPINTKVNNFIADIYEQAERDSKQRLSPEDEAAMWGSDERPNDPDNPCDVCSARMPINPLTAIFGCHYDCRDEELATGEQP